MKKPILAILTIFSPAYVSKISADEAALSRLVEEFRTSVPAIEGVLDRGRYILDVDGNSFGLYRLSLASKLLEVQGDSDALFLCSFLRDSDAKIRFICAKRLELYLNPELSVTKAPLIADPNAAIREQYLVNLLKRISEKLNKANPKPGAPVKPSK